MKSARPELIIVEDDRRFGESLIKDFEDRGYQCTLFTRVSEMREISASLRFAILDLKVGPENGLSALEKILKVAPTCRAVILTGYGTVATAVRAGQMGAVHYLTKPVSVEKLEKTLWYGAGSLEDEPHSEKPPSLALHEREYIEFILDQCDGNITRAAEWLGLHRQSLQRKLRKYVPKD
jgi:two-component system response regulator RegA